MKVKICGITDVHTALDAIRYGADAIGFVFAESKRQITPDKAREISIQLPEKTLKIGVFVNETIEEIERIAVLAALTHVQLHGNESAAFCKSLSMPVIKAFSVESSQSIGNIGDYPCDYLLLDGPKGMYHGGNGIAFEWGKIDKNIFKDKKVILAGGLTIGNVSDGIRIINPDMVDVSSGVETNGVKDLEKIKLFIEQAKGA